jgi:hypothetical protein
MNKNELGLTTLSMKSSILWDITPCGPLKVNQRSGGICRLHLHGLRVSEVRNGLHGVLSQKRELFKTNAMSNTNPTTFVYILPIRNAIEIRSVVSENTDGLTRPRHYAIVFCK